MRAGQSRWQLPRVPNRRPQVLFRDAKPHRRHHAGEPRDLHEQHLPGSSSCDQKCCDKIENYSDSPEDAKPYQGTRSGNHGFP